MIEFSTDPMTGEAMYQQVGEPIVRQLTTKDTEVIAEILERSSTFYPEQFEALSKEYAKSSSNKQYYDFLRARRIINCCFGENDRQPDIDENGNYHFEMVKCPRIAECKYFKIICQPKFDSTLSERELEVMRLYFENRKTECIAEELFLSIHTVKNHRRNALQKLGLHSLKEFHNYAHTNNLFKK
jgi:DNA-binding CsgD family transcriptional regulator